MFTFNDKSILSSNEACAYLDISKSCLYKLTHTKVLPYYCPNGKKIYFKKDDLVSWMLTNHQQSKEEIKAKAYLLIQNSKGGVSWSK